uniref:Uncharacterized protein n=1 Tax=Octopus bimaculoides TaxID=37653 RepID=A0A0L8GIQ5_OCTBM
MITYETHQIAVLSTDVSMAAQSGLFAPEICFSVVAGNFVIMPVMSKTAIIDIKKEIAEYFY